MSSRFADQESRDPKDGIAAEPSSGAGVEPSPVSAGLSVRRWFLVASPVLAGMFAVLGAAADPAVGADGVVLWKAYAENPEPLQFKSFGFHWAYAFWIVPTFLIAGLVRGRGVWLANLAVLIDFVGLSTLPGLLFVDFYDSAIGQVAGVETTAQVAETMEGMWGPPAIATPGIIGFVFGLPLAAVAAWRAGLVRWWGPLAVVAGFFAFGLSNVAVWGTILTTVCFTVFSYELIRGTDPDRAAQARRAAAPA